VRQIDILERCIELASGFFDRVVSRLDKLDRESIQTYMASLDQERGFLETIFQSIQEGIIVVDSDGQLLYANRAAETLAGFQYNKVKGRSILRFLKDWGWEHLLEMPDSVSEGWSRMVTREIEINYPDYRVVAVSARPLDVEDLSDAGILIILRDITKERQEEASALESGRSDAVKLLAAGVAHEIGNPLNALNIHLQLLVRELSEVKDHKIRKSLEELVGVAKMEVERLDTTISQFLRAIRPSKPVLEAECPTVVMQETLNLLKTEFENRRIAVSVDIPDNIPTVHLDRSLIKQVFFNLIKNALEAMPDGGALKIVFSVDDAYVNIAFCDNGGGISEENMRLIFEPYHTTKQDGSGLGLMIVQRIIDDHGGEIELSSKQEEGTCFKIRLPRSERRIRMLKKGGQ
jgi:two-component system, sporulation sensor kinase E